MSDREEKTKMNSPSVVFIHINHRASALDGFSAGQPLEASASSYNFSRRYLRR